MSGSFNRSATIRRPRYIPNGSGGTTRSTKDLILNVRGRLTPVKASDARIATGDGEVIDYRFSTRGGAPVQDGDVLELDGIEVKVVAVKKTSSGRRIEAECRRVYRGE